MDTSTTSTPDIKTYLARLADQSSRILDDSTAGCNSAKIAKGHSFLEDLRTWTETLATNKESELLKIATTEYESSILFLAQGYYRQAFKGLRLTLELCLQAIYLSTNEIHLREWLANQRDTSWSLITDEVAGIFSTAFTNAFFPEIKKHSKHHQELSKSLYRECSECIHGNIPQHIPLPTTLVFDQKIFDLWLDKALNVARVINFALSTRYMCDFSETEKEQLEPIINDRLGHIEELRHILGGPARG